MVRSFALGLLVLLVAHIFCVHLGTALFVFGGVAGLIGVFGGASWASVVFLILSLLLYLTAQGLLPMELLGEGFSEKAYFGYMSSLRNFFRVRLDEFAYRSQDAGSFLSAFMVGTPMGRADSTLLKELGVFHLVVVSGLHVSFCMAAVQKALLPMHWLIASQKLAGKRTLRSIVYFLSSVFCVLFVFVSDGRASAKRALSLSVLKDTARVFLPGVNKIDLICFVFAAHGILFAKDFFTFGCFLSWAAYFLLWTSPGSILSLLVTNVWLSLLGFAFFGVFHPLSFLINFFLTPLFAVLFAFAWGLFLLDLVFPFLPVYPVFFAVESVLSGLSWLHSGSVWMLWKGEDWGLARGCVGGLLSVVFASRCFVLCKLNQ